MAGPVTCKQDAIEWVNKLKEKKIKKFKFKNLPAELKIKELLHKASALKLIVKVGKIRGNIAVWRIAQYRRKLKWVKRRNHYAQNVLL